MMAVRNELIQFDKDFNTNWKEMRDICKDINNGNKDADVWLPVLINAYTGQIRKYMSLLSKEEEDDAMIEAELEKWLWGTELSGTFSVQSFSSAAHPIYMMNKWYLDLIKREFNFMNNDREKEICLSIVRSKVKNRQKFHLNYLGNGYKVHHEKDCIKNFQKYGSLTEIQGFRLIEKIEDLQEKLNKSEVKIAYLGSLVELDWLKEYFAKKNTGMPLFYQYSFMDESIFYNNDIKEELNLHDIFALKKLLQSYDLVLFLDESYFYKRYQSHKEKKEERADEYIEWYYQMLKEATNYISKINIHYSIFELANKYMAGKNSHMSAEYEYDEQLIKRIEALVNGFQQPCADVYFYMNNSRMADRDIEVLNVCKDELYDGKNLIVYKVSNKTSDAGGIGTSLVNEISSQFAEIDLWKIIKSIGNDYFRNYWEEEWKNHNLRELKNTNIIFYDFSLKGSENKKLQIKYSIRIPDTVISEDKEEKIEGFVEAVFSLLQNENTMICVRDYLRKLISSSLLSRANSVKDIMMSYFILKKNGIEFKVADEKERNNELVRENKISSYKEKKSVYTMLEKLDSMFVRDIKQLKQILFIDLKTLYFDDMGDEEFKKYLLDIHTICQEMGDCESRLYLHTDI